MIESISEFWDIHDENHLSPGISTKVVSFANRNENNTEYIVSDNLVNPVNSAI